MCDKVIIICKLFGEVLPTVTRVLRSFQNEIPLPIGITWYVSPRSNHILHV